MENVRTFWTTFDEFSFWSRSNLLSSELKANLNVMGRIESLKLKHTEEVKFYAKSPKNGGIFVPNSLDGVFRFIN